MSYQRKFGEFTISRNHITYINKHLKLGFVITEHKEDPNLKNQVKTTMSKTIGDAEITLWCRSYKGNSHRWDRSSDIITRFNSNKPVITLADGSTCVISYWNLKRSM